MKLTGGGDDTSALCGMTGKFLERTTLTITVRSTTSGAANKLTLTIVFDRAVLVALTILVSLTARTGGKSTDPSGVADQPGIAISVTFALSRRSVTGAFGTKLSGLTITVLCALAWCRRSTEALAVANLTGLTIAVSATDALSDLTATVRIADLTLTALGISLAGATSCRRHNTVFAFGLATCARIPTESAILICCADWRTDGFAALESGSLTDLIDLAILVTFAGRGLCQHSRRPEESHAQQHRAPDEEYPPALFRQHLSVSFAVLSRLFYCGSQC
jgi:hypothetical protein